MSSFISSYRPSSKLTGASECSILTYNERGTDIPVPFVFDKRTSALDIDFTSGFTDYTDIDSDERTKFKYQPFGAVFLVEKIGPNFIKWLEVSHNADAESVVIHENPIIIPVNATALQKKANSDAPKTYQTVLFKTKLVIQFTTNYGVRKEHLTFTTHME